MFENLREDWHTYQGDIQRQGLWVMAVYRLGRWRYGIRSRALRLPFSFVYRGLKVLSQIMTGIELPAETKVGHRFLIEHFGGIIISGDAVFGDDCIIRNNVTVGLRRTGVQGAPHIGDRVDVGVGAVLLGPINIGNDVSIGANAVVLVDVPDNCIAVGVPAIVKPKKKSKEEHQLTALSAERSA
jgi:serine O-acetyltransferase